MRGGEGGSTPDPRVILVTWRCCETHLLPWDDVSEIMTAAAANATAAAIASTAASSAVIAVAKAETEADASSAATAAAASPVLEAGGVSAVICASVPVAAATATVTAAATAAATVTRASSGPDLGSQGPFLAGERAERKPLRHLPEPLLRFRTLLARKFPLVDPVPPSFRASTADHPS